MFFGLKVVHFTNLGWCMVPGGALCVLGNWPRSDPEVTQKCTPILWRLKVVHFTNLKKMFFGLNAMTWANLFWCRKGVCWVKCYDLSQSIWVQKGHCTSMMEGIVPVWWGIVPVWWRVLYQYGGALYQYVGVEQILVDRFEPSNVLNWLQDEYFD